MAETKLNHGTIEGYILKIIKQKELEMSKWNEWHSTQSQKLLLQS